MKRVPGNLKYSPNRRRMYLDETRFGPLFKLLLGLAAVAAFALAVVLLLVPLLTGWFTGMPVSYPWERAALPAGETAPFVPGPVRTLSLPADAVADPSVYGGRLLFAAGDSPEKCDRLLRLDPETGESETVEPPLLHDTLRYPVEDGERILYLDMKSGGGGGDVRCLDKATGEAETLFAVAAGAPKLFYESPYLLLTLPTGASESKLVAWDVISGENVTLAVFQGTPYAYSAPSLRSGQAVYADEDPSVPGGSLIRTLLLHDGSRWDYAVDGYVHDPQSMGDRWVFFDSDHAADGTLYLSVQGGAAKSIARGAAECFITPSCAVYGRDGTVFAYAFADGRTHVLSPGERACRLLFAGEDYALWTDETDPDDAVLQYCKLG